MKIRLFKHLIVPCLVLCCLAGSAFPFTDEEELPRAEKILEKYVKATGGLENFDKIKNRVVNSTLLLKDQNIKIAMTTFTAKPNLSYMKMESDLIGKRESGCNGKVVWEVSDMTGPVIKEGEEARFFLRESVFERFVYWKKVYAKAECQAVVMVEGKPCYKIVLFPKKEASEKEGKPTILYIDKESFLITMVEVQVMSPMGHIPVKSYFKDYKKVDNILVSHKSALEMLGRKREVVITKIQQNVKLPKDRFQLPEAIQSLLDRQ